MVGDIFVRRGLTGNVVMRDMQNPLWILLGTVRIIILVPF